MFLKYLSVGNGIPQMMNGKGFLYFKGFWKWKNIIFETKFIGFGLFIGDYFKYFANLQVKAWEMFSLCDFIP